MKVRSIRRYLLAGVAGVQLLAAVLGTVLVVRHEERQSYALLDAELEEHAAMVKSVIEPPDNPAVRTILHRELLTLPKRDVYVLGDAGGAVIAASGDWRPNGPLPAAQQSFLDLDVNGRPYRGLVERSFPLFNDEPDEVALLPKLVLVYASPVGRVREHIWHVGWIAGAIGLTILLASLGATGWVVRTGLEPVTQLAARAAKIDALHWEWERVGDYGGDQAEELEPLAMTLEGLVERLKAAFVRERQFSADAAHEMKTAVAIVKSTLQLALEREGTAEEYRAGVERALEDTDRMQGLVSGMLQLAKVEGLVSRGRSGEQGGECADVMEQIGAVVRRLGPVLTARRIQVAVGRPAGSPGEGHGRKMTVRISGESLAMVLTNLLENAIHYSPDGGGIEVKAEAAAESCTISIADHGCGIDAEALPHIFERFYRGDRSRSRESGGAGLGLAIARAIVVGAGGTLSAESTPGAGSVFTLVLPRADD